MIFFCYKTSKGYEILHRKGLERYGKTCEGEMHPGWKNDKLLQAFKENDIYVIVSKTNKIINFSNTNEFTKLIFELVGMEKLIPPYSKRQRNYPRSN